MVLLFGTASEICGDRRSRAIRVLRSLPRCRELSHLRGAGRQHGARGLVGFETRGVEGQPAEVSHAANGPLGVCHQRFVFRTAFESPRASKNTPARVRSAASNWRGSTRCVPLSARVWREMKATPRFFSPPLRADGLERDGVDCHIVCPIPTGTSLPRWEGLLRPHQLQAIEKFAERGG